MTRSVVGVIEAAYKLDLDEAQWLGGIAERACPLLDRGLGMHAYVYDLNGDARFKTTTHLTPGAGDRWQENWRELTESAQGRDFLHYVHRSQPRFGLLSSFMDGAGAARPFVEQVMQRSGYADFLSVNSLDPSGVGVFLGIPAAERARVDRKLAARWARVGSHIAAALRLRRRSPESAPVDAMFTPDARLDHVEDPTLQQETRDALREAVVAVERSRSSPIGEQDVAVEQWRALQEGRWTLVDQFERGGRRYVVARRNPPEVATPAALTERERQVVAYVAMGHSNKYIAYELGLSMPSISTYLARAMRKLGVRSRVQLAELVSEVG
jgi:DNA-binding CsgD family transcriptional regulator